MRHAAAIALLSLMLTGCAGKRREAWPYITATCPATAYFDPRASKCYIDPADGKKYCDRVEVKESCVPATSGKKK